MWQVPTLQQDLMAKHYEGKNNEKKNEEGIHLHLDLLDEVRATTEQWMSCYQDHAKVKPWHFSIGDLVLRKVTTTAKDLGQGNLGLNWEGPYIIIDCNKKGT